MALPTRQVLAHRMGNHKNLCHLCGENKESDSHIFFHCQFSRALRFGCSINDSEDILKFVLEPPLQSGTPSVEASIKLALTLEVIWSTRNKVALNHEKICLPSILKHLELRVTKHNESRTSCWNGPHVGFTKLNVDAAISNDHTSLAVMGDTQGKVIKAWRKKAQVM